jgi:acyl-coenzyme A thioesterase PaaI-like protein
MPTGTIDIRSSHLRATADGHVTIELAGPVTGPARAATLALTSARRISTRWLGSGRPRVVTFGAAHVVLEPGTSTSVTIRLSRERLALLRRMRTVRATARVTTEGNHGRTVAVSRRLNLDAPRRP